MYKLIFEKRALKSLAKLDNQIRKRIWNRLQIAKENPFRYFEKLVEIHSFKLRIGDYRVIADIFRNRGAIVVLKIGHRKNVYAKDSKRK